jgi:hypothetical protein
MELALELEDEVVEVILGSSVNVEVKDGEVEMVSVTGSELTVDVDEASAFEVSPPSKEVEVGEADALMARAFFSAAFVMTGRGLAAALASRSLRHSMLVKHRFSAGAIGSESPWTIVANEAKMIVQRIVVMKQGSQLEVFVEMLAKGEKMSDKDSSSRSGCLLYLKMQAINITYCQSAG